MILPGCSTGGAYLMLSGATVAVAVAARGGTVTGGATRTPCCRGRPGGRRCGHAPHAEVELLPVDGVDEPLDLGELGSARTRCDSEGDGSGSGQPVRPAPADPGGI